MARRHITDFLANPGTPNIRNLVVLDPDKITKAKWLTYDDDKHFTLFATPGIVTHSSLKNDDKENRELFTVPFVDTFFREMAVLGKTLGVDELYMRTYKKGIAYSTQHPSSFKRSFSFVYKLTYNLRQNRYGF